MPTAVQHDFTTVPLGQDLSVVAPAVGAAWSGSWSGNSGATATEWVGQGSGIASSVSTAYAATVFATDGGADLVISVVLAGPVIPDVGFSTTLGILVENPSGDSMIGMTIYAGPGDYESSLICNSPNTGFIAESAGVGPLTWPTTFTLEINRSTGTAVMRLNGAALITGVGFAAALSGKDTLRVILGAELDLDVSTRSALMSSVLVTSSAAVTYPGDPGPDPEPELPEPTVRIFDSFDTLPGDWPRTWAVDVTDPLSPPSLWRASRTPPVQEGVTGLRWEAYELGGTLRNQSGSLEVVASYPSTDGGQTYVFLLPSSHPSASGPWTAAARLAAFAGLQETFQSIPWTVISLRAPGGFNRGQTFGATDQTGLYARFAFSSGSVGDIGVEPTVSGGIRVADITLAKPSPTWEPDTLIIERSGTIVVRGVGGSVSTTLMDPISELLGIYFVSSSDVVPLVVSEFELTLDGELVPQRFWTDFIGTYEVL